MWKTIENKKQQRSLLSDVAVCESESGLSSCCSGSAERAFISDTNHGRPVVSVMSCLDDRAELEAAFASVHSTVLSGGHSDISQFPADVLRHHAHVPAVG